MIPSCPWNAPDPFPTPQFYFYSKVVFLNQHSVKRYKGRRIFYEKSGISISKRKVKIISHLFSFACLGGIFGRG